MNKARLQKNRNRRGERGSILAVSALGMLTTLLAVGLGVDVSRFYLAKTEMQNAADAAALAGASALNSNPSGITNAATRAAEQLVNKYDFNKTNVPLSRANVTFAVNLDGPYMGEGAAHSSPNNIRFVRVSIPEAPIGVSFAAMVLGNNKNIGATATAGLSVPLNVFCNFIPLSVIDYDIPMTPGQVYTVRADTGGSPSPGNYQILAVAGPGGVDVEYGIGSGVDACAEPGSTYSVDTKPGVTAGKVRKGINSRFDDYAGSQLSPVDQPPDTNVKEGITYREYVMARDAASINFHKSSLYQSPSHAGVEDRRVVLIPIVKLAEYDSGRGIVRFNRFGAFFLRTKVGGGSGGDFQAEYIEDRIAVGRGKYNPSGSAGNLLITAPVLYR